MGEQLPLGQGQVGTEGLRPGRMLQKRLLGQFHDRVLAGHPGVDRTRVIRSIFWWPRMDRDIVTFVQSRVGCAGGMASLLGAGGLLQPLPVPRVPWEHTGIDWVVGLPMTGDQSLSCADLQKWHTLCQQSKRLPQKT